MQCKCKTNTIQSSLADSSHHHSLNIQRKYKTNGIQIQQIQCTYNKNKTNAAQIQQIRYKYNANAKQNKANEKHTIHIQCKCKKIPYNTMEIQHKYATNTIKI